MSRQIQRLDLSQLAQYWIDDSQDTPITAVEARASAGLDLFKPYNAEDTYRIHGKTLWLRFETQALDTQSRWLLELGSSSLDNVQLFWRDNNNQWLMLQAGDKTPRSQWPTQTRLPVFMLDAAQGQPQTFYLRIVNQRSPVSLSLLIYQDAHYLGVLQTETILLGGYFGWALIVLLASLSMAVLMQERSFLAYSGYLLALGVFMFCNLGLASHYLWPESPRVADRAVFVAASLTAALGPWFVRLILQPVTRLRLINAGISLLVIFMTVTAVVEAFHPTQLSYAVVNGGTILALVVIYIVIFATWQRGDTTTRLIALGFLPVGLGAIPLLLRNLALIPNSSLTYYSLLTASAIEMPVLLYALIQRSSIRRDSRMRAAGLPTHDALTGLFNMRTLLEHMHGVMTRSNRYKHAYGLVLVELNNAAWFAKEHGQEMADRALVLLAVRIQKFAREVDTVCRIDKTHFVLLLEGPCTARQMAQVTARISASALQPNEVLPVGASLKLKITSALLPTTESLEAGDDAHAQLGWLIAAAERLPADQRKAVVSIGF